MAEDFWNKMHNILWESSQRSAVFVLLRQTKMYVRGMSLISFDLIQESFGKNIPQANTPLEALKNFNKTENEIGFIKQDDVSIAEKDNGIEVIMNNCPYGKPCIKLLNDLKKSGEFNEKTLPCLRLGLYSASIEKLSGKNSSYSLVQFAPGIKCTGNIEVM